MSPMLRRETTLYKQILSLLVVLDTLRQLTQVTILELVKLVSLIIRNTMTMTNMNLVVKLTNTNPVLVLS